MSGSFDPGKLRSLATELRGLRHGDLATSGADALLDAARRIVVEACLAGAFHDHPDVVAAARAATRADLPFYQLDNADKALKQIAEAFSGALKPLWEGEPSTCETNEFVQFAGLDALAGAIETYAKQAERRQPERRPNRSEPAERKRRRKENLQRQKREDAILADWESGDHLNLDWYVEWRNERLPKGWPELDVAEVRRAIDAARKRRNRKGRQT